MQKAKALDDTKTTTLQTELDIKIGIILEITTNVDVLDGLYNGAWGYLRYIDPPNTSRPQILWIDFANASIGKHTRTRYAKLYENRPSVTTSSTPVLQVSRTFQAMSRQESTILRWQFPIRPATAGTFHHNQGLNLLQGAVNIRGPKHFPKMAGRHYVGYSRFRRPEGNLLVLDSAFDEFYTDPRVHTEMKRMRKDRQIVSAFNGLQQSSQSPNLIQCVLHNTRSLPAHIDDIRSNCNLLSADVLIFTESRVKTSF